MAKKAHDWGEVGTSNGGANGMGVGGHERGSAKGVYQHAHDEQMERFDAIAKTADTSMGNMTGDHAVKGIKNTRTGGY